MPQSVAKTGVDVKRVAFTILRAMQHCVYRSEIIIALYLLPVYALPSRQLRSRLHNLPSCVQPSNVCNRTLNNANKMDQIAPVPIRDTESVCMPLHQRMLRKRELCFPVAPASFIQSPNLSNPSWNVVPLSESVIC